MVCGHGSTCGQLDEDSLFYLMSRGIPKAEAETMLVRGFLAELIDPIEDEALNEALTSVIEDWLGGGVRNGNAPPPGALRAPTSPPRERWQGARSRNWPPLPGGRGRRASAGEGAFGPPRCRNKR